MPDRCPECGALLNAGEDCRTIFESMLALEFTDPGYGEVHLLTVACYMVQHNQYSDEALVWIAGVLDSVINGGLPAEQVRRKMAQETKPAARTWKVTRQAGDRALPKIPWSMTIADVARQYRDAASYCELVRAWARNTLVEMKPLLSK